MGIAILLIVSITVLIVYLVCLKKFYGASPTDIAKGLKDGIKESIEVSTQTQNTVSPITPDTYDLVKNSQNKQKDSSVIGSAVVGSIIAGPVGGVVGAIHAADKNNRKKK